jgi:hypothetical protein
MKYNIVILLGLIACGDSEPETVVSAPAKTEEVGKKSPPPPPAKAAPTASPSNCGQDLKEYGAFVDEYIVYMQKVSAGDMSAMAQAQGIMQKSEKASQDILKLQKDGKLDIPCFKKYQEINNRMTNAAMEMSGASEEEKEERAELEEVQKASDKAMDNLGCIQACQTETDPMKQMTCIQGCQ